MTALTPAEIKQLQQEQETYMPQSVVVKRTFFVEGDDVSFGPQVIATAVPCRLTAGFGQWRSVADRFQGVTAYTATVPWNTDIKAGDVIVDEESRSFEIRDVAAPSSYLTARRCLVDLVTDG